MNERIKELILKAGWKNAYTNPKEGFELVFESEDHTLACVKKFADLIIKECINVADDETMDDTVGYAILEHFGVK